MAYNNLFIECWNKAVTELGEMVTPNDGYALYLRTYDTDPVFTIETKLPILLEIIDYLNKTKK
jgi:hypothetical protein